MIVARSEVSPRVEWTDWAQPLLEYRMGFRPLVLIGDLTWRVVAGGWWAGRAWYCCRAGVLTAVAHMEPIARRGDR